MSERFVVTAFYRPTPVHTHRIGIANGRVDAVVLMESWVETSDFDESTTRQLAEFLDEGKGRHFVSVYRADGVSLGSVAPIEER